MEWFVILDITHQEAAFHAPDKDWYLQQLSPEDTEKLARMEENGSDYADLWKTFFEHIGIKERKNPASSSLPETSNGISGLISISRSAADSHRLSPVLPGSELLSVWNMLFVFLSLYHTQSIG